MLEIRGLSLTYPDGTRALVDLDMDIPTGMFGLLGPNGAGKSTLMRTLACLQIPDRGTIRFNRLDVLEQPLQLQQQLGYLPQYFGTYPYLACRSLLLHMAVLKGLRDNSATRQHIEQLLTLTNLEQVADRPVARFSGGMRQRFGIAQALLGSPRLLILDEPTAGLDPEERLRFHALLSQLGHDRLVLLSTHIVDDIENLCRHCAILQQGHIAVTGSLEQLLAPLHGKIWQAEDDTVAADDAMLLSTSYRHGVPTRRYYCQQQPGPAYIPVDAILQDRYFHQLQLRSVQPC